MHSNEVKRIWSGSIWIDRWIEACQLSNLLKISGQVAMELITSPKCCLVRTLTTIAT